MKEIEIDFSAYYDKWVNNIEEGLRSRDIAFDTTLPLTICSSLRRTVCKFLSKRGYRPIDNFTYRSSLAKRLAKEGLKLEIRSNRLLWKYLEYFTDLDDYSLCFDIQVCIADLDKARMHNVDIKKTPLCYELSIDNFLSNSEQYYQISDEINELKNLKDVSNNCEIKLDKVVQILQLFLDRLEEISREKDRGRNSNNRC